MSLPGNSVTVSRSLHQTEGLRKIWTFLLAPSIWEHREANSWIIGRNGDTKYIDMQKKTGAAY